MNPMSLLAILFGCAAIFLAYAAIVYRDVVKRLLQMNDAYSNAANDLVAHCEALELRNAWLESEADRLNDLRAAGHMYLPSYRIRGKEMVSVEREGMP